MRRAILIDREFGEHRPSLATEADVRAVEATPFRDRVDAPSTYDAIRIGAAYDPSAPAIQFLPNADPDEPALVISHAEFLARVMLSPWGAFKRHYTAHGRLSDKKTGALPRNTAVWRLLTLRLAVQACSSRAGVCPVGYSTRSAPAAPPGRANAAPMPNTAR